MTDIEDTEKRFLEDIATHEMTVIKEDGVFRHLQFKKPGTRYYQFDLITWPGYLCYCGDMGTYVFQRTHDMFEFFRRNDKSYRIDFRYWAEKCEAADTNGGGITKFSFEKFKAEILDWLQQDKEANEPNSDDSEQLLKWELAYTELGENVKSEVLDCDENSNVRCFNAAYNFRHTGGAWAEFHGYSARFEFTAFWEEDCKEYTHGFVWCCNALAWGIAKYDAAKATQIEDD